jgi:IS30 family transposase
MNNILSTQKNAATNLRRFNQRPRKTLDYDTPQNRFKAERDTPERALR